MASPRKEPAAGQAATRKRARSAAEKRKARAAAKKNFAEQLAAVRLAVSEARVIAKETAGDDDAMQRALIRIAQSRLFTILRDLADLKGKPLATALPDLHAIARTICAMTKQEIELERWRAEARSRVGAGLDAAAARVEEARGSGLTPDAAEKIRGALLEIKL
jgi:hypothetical protein